MTKYKVPDGMLKAFKEAYRAEYGCLPHSVHMQKIVRSFEAALRWLAENPPLPTEKQCNEMWRAADNHGDRYCQEWIRRMFLAEPEVPEEIEDLQVNDLDMGWDGPINKRILEAYKRGQKNPISS